MPPRVLASGPKPCGGNNLRSVHFEFVRPSFFLFCLVLNVLEPGNNKT